MIVANLREGFLGRRYHELVANPRELTSVGNQSISFLSSPPWGGESQGKSRKSKVRRWDFYRIRVPAVTGFSLTQTFLPL